MRKKKLTIYYGSFNEVKDTITKDYLTEDIGLAEFFRTCYTPDLSVEDVVKALCGIKT